MATRRPTRLPSFDYRGRHSYFVTFCVFERRAALSSAERVECVRFEIVRTCEEQRFAIPAIVFMPDHVHMLIAGQDENCQFKTAMTLLRQRTAHAFHVRFGDRLWQDGYHERVLRRADNPAETVNYIVNNPVRAGLCERAEDYPYAWRTPLT